jgi:hypothetical protein
MKAHRVIRGGKSGLPEAATDLAKDLANPCLRQVRRQGARQLISQFRLQLPGRSADTVVSRHLCLLCLGIGSQSLLRQRRLVSITLSPALPLRLFQCHSFLTPFTFDSIMTYDSHPQERFYQRHWEAGFEDKSNIPGLTISRVGDRTSSLDPSDRWFGWTSSETEKMARFRMVRDIIKGAGK